MATEGVRYELDGDAADLLQALDAVVRAFREVKGGADDAGKKLDNVQAKSKTAAGGGKELDAALKGLEKGAKSLGGTLGNTADFVFDMGEAVAGMASPVGVAVGVIGGLALACTAAAVGTVALERGAAQAIDRLEVLGASDLISADQTDAVLEANAALDALGASADVVMVALAAGLAPAVVEIVSELGTLVLFVGKVVGAFDVGSLSINSWTSLLGAVVVGGITPFIDALLQVHRFLGTNTDAMEGFAEGLHETAAALADDAIALHDDTEAQKAQNRETINFSELMEKALKKRQEGTAAAKTHADAQREAAKAARELEQVYRAELDALDKIGEIGQKAGADLLSAAEKLNVAYEEQLATISQLEQKALDAAEKRGASEDELTSISETAAAARADVDAQYHRDRIAAEEDSRDAIFEIWGEYTEKYKEEKEKQAEEDEKQSKAQAELALETISTVLSAVETLADAFTDLHEERLSQLESEREQLREDWIEAVSAARKSGKAMTQAEKERHSASMKMNQEAQDEERKKLMTSFAISKGVAIAQAMTAGAMAAMAMIPGIAMAMGPAAAGAPAVAAGISAIATAANVAVIAAQQPSFHVGLNPDEFSATLKKGEAVVTEGGVQKLGPDTIRAANNGTLGSGGQGSQRAQVNQYILGGKVIDTTTSYGVRFGEQTRRELELAAVSAVGAGKYAGRV